MATPVTALVTLDGIPVFPVTIHIASGRILVDFSQLFEESRVTKYIIDALPTVFLKAIRDQNPDAYFEHDKPSGRDVGALGYVSRRLVMCLDSVEIFLESLRNTKAHHVPCRATLAMIQTALFKRRYHLAFLVQSRQWLSVARTFCIAQ